VAPPKPAARKRSARSALSRRSPVADDHDDDEYALVEAATAHADALSRRSPIADDHDDDDDEAHDEYALVEAATAHADALARRQEPPPPAPAPIYPGPSPRYSADPIFDALKLLTPAAMRNANAVIRNRFDAENRGQFVLGIAGSTPAPLTVTVPATDSSPNADYAFDANAAWTIRWDFAWDGRPPFTDKTIRGPNVQVDIQAFDNPAHNVSVAFYPSNDSEMAKAEDHGNYYFEYVLAPLRRTAMFDAMTGAFQFNEVYSARAIAQSWYDNWKAKGGVELPPFTPVPQPS
jgi:hypothetical protein